MSRKPRRDAMYDSLDKGEFVGDLRKFADNCIHFFFNEKGYHIGGPIPECELTTEFAQKTVLHTQFDDRCFDFLHEVCLPLFPVDPEYDEPPVPWTVHKLLGLIADLKNLEIPKEFQPGLLLLYFKFCHGVEIPPPPLL